MWPTFVLRLSGDQDYSVYPNKESSMSTTDTCYGSNDKTVTNYDDSSCDILLLCNFLNDKLIGY